MILYKMTATFGKLEHDTLTLEPGMNIIHAPNEWGKSTWCAFLMAMLYGLDTRSKTTKTALADKERYAPWSGSPMFGRIDLRWDGKDITIERTTKGRIPLGEFRAYETKTGLPVPELTANNCGEMLLGVEQSVFRRAGFIRLSDMPVTADDSLRRRLNALVTTGDESGDADRLEKGLKDLKNRCRYNRSGLIPQAEAEAAELEKKLRELEGLENQSKKLRSRLGEVKSWTRELENHRDALAYAASEADAEKVAHARESWEEAEKRLLELENSCAHLPKQEEAERKIQQIRTFRKQWESARMEQELLPEGPEAPAAPEPFENMPLPHARDMVGEDIQRYELLTKTKPYLAPLLMAWAFLFLGILAAVYQEWIAAAFGDIAGLLLLWLGCRKKRSWQGESYAFVEKYGSDIPEEWLARLEDYEQALRDYKQRRLSHNALRGDLDGRLAALQKQRQSLCGEQEPEQVLQVWQQALELWEAYHAARRDAQRAKNHLDTLRSMAKTAQPPRMEDNLCYTGEETAQLLSEALAEQQRLQSRLGQYRGRMEALGDGEELQAQLMKAEARIAKLEDIYAAATLGLETLNRAKLELQRRFAPRISRRAQELLGAMTGGRYDRLTLGEDFRLRAGAGEEDTLHDALWRSDGTVDQLYLALRLAVSEELTPNAPLILDDAFVRFDEKRLEAALALLKEMSKTRQIILFSCQQREKNMASQ